MLDGVTQKGVLGGAPVLPVTLKAVNKGKRMDG